MTDMPGHVLDILQTLASEGYGAYLVGGCLRDMLLGRPVHDWDITTTARTQEVSALFERTVETGVRYGTVTVVTGAGCVEVTTMRSDGAYADGRRPETVSFIDDLREDLRRRDFTINAMALGPDGALVDLFGGRADLQRRLIRCVGSAADRFSEDALRMLRAVRFSAQLGFEIEGKTLAALGELAPLCAGLSAERVRDETEKILLSDRPELLEQAVSLGLFVGRLAGEGAPRHLSRIGALPVCAAPRWCAFSAALARAGLVDAPGRFLRSLRLDGATVKSGGAGAEKALAGPLPDTPAGLKGLLAALGRAGALCAAAADEVLRGSGAVAAVEQVISSGECWSYNTLAVTGDDLIALGMEPGTRLGRALGGLLNHVIEHPADNTRERLLPLARQMMGGWLPQRRGMMRDAEDGVPYGVG